MQPITPAAWMDAPPQRRRQEGGEPLRNTRKRNPNDSRFLNFKLCFLAETFENPEATLTGILHYCIVKYTKNCKADWKDALAQLAYYKARNVKNPLSKDVAKFAQAEPLLMNMIQTHVDDAFRIGRNTEEGYRLAMRQFIGRILNRAGSTYSPPEKQQDALVAWWRLTASANFFNITLGNCESTWNSASQLAELVKQHEAQHGTDAPATVPRNYFWETLETARNEQDGNRLLEAMRLFRMVAAVRGLIGKKQIARTNKDMIRARCIGGKSPAVARQLAARNPLLQAELEALQSRYRFDRILNEGGGRNFYLNVGIGRGIHLSTLLQDEKEFTQAATKRRTIKAKHTQMQRDIRAAIAARSIVASK